MDSKDLTPDQIDRLRRRAEADYRYLVAIRSRMNALEFPVCDPMRRAYEEAMDASYRVTQALSDWGKPKKPTPDLSKMKVT